MRLDPPPSSSLPCGAPPASSVRWYQSISPETRDAQESLWDPVEGRVDLREFSIDALKALHLHALRNCEEARYVVLPAHCPAQVLHSLLIGLPRLEGLMAWSPSDPDAVRLTLGRHLIAFVSDAATVRQMTPVEGVKAMAGSGPDLSIDAVATACEFATLPRRHPAIAPASSSSSASGLRPLSLFLGEAGPTLTPSVAVGRRRAITPSAAVGERLANWQAPRLSVSRPPLSLTGTPDTTPRGTPNASPSATSASTPRGSPRGSPRTVRGSPRSAPGSPRSVPKFLRDWENAFRKWSQRPPRRSRSV